MVKVSCTVKGCISEKVEATPGQRFKCSNGHMSLCRLNGQVSPMVAVSKNGFGAIRGLKHRVLPPVHDKTQQELVLEKQRKPRISTSLQSINQLVSTNQPDARLGMSKDEYKKLEKSTKRIVGGHGDLFGAVLKGWKAVHATGEEPALQQLEKAANTYLADIKRREEESKNTRKPFVPDKVTTHKIAAAKDALERIRQLRARRELVQEYSKLPVLPRTQQDEQVVNRLRGKLITESGGTSPIQSEEGKGASESYFLTDPITKEKAFVFKPGDGEATTGFGWTKGGGASREVMVSAINEELRLQVGLDCGVAPTTLVSLDHPSMGSNSSGGKTKRVGALQNFVKREGIDPDVHSLGNKAFLNTLPRAEIEKIAILDFVTLQMDRQTDNVLVSKSNEGQFQLTPIDGGSSFPGRQAFESFRRQFTSNQLLSGEGANEPFSEESLEKIQALDEEKIAECLRKNKQSMSELDPSTGSKFDYECIDITRRSVQFLKAASKLLTKAQIARAYAYGFQNVIDAAPEDVTKIIDKVIKAELSAQAKRERVEQLPDSKAKLLMLGWPPKEYERLMTEDPAMLLKILDQDRTCDGTVKKIDELNEKLKQDMEDKILLIESLWEKYSALIALEKKLEADSWLKKKDLVERATKAGWELKGTTEDKAAQLQRFDAYTKAGGDELIRSQGQDPLKLTVEEKYYYSLGGDEAYQKLAKSGLEVDLKRKVGTKLSDLESYNEYLKLGGDEVFAQLGGIVATIISRRVIFMKENLVNVDREGPTGMLETLERMLELIVLTKDRCELAEIELGKKRVPFAELEKQTREPMDEKTREERLKLVNEADLFISAIVKKFGPWNAKIITPWKQHQNTIKSDKRMWTDERIKDLNREVSTAYDAYVDVFGSAQDLGQDYLDMLRRAKDRLQGNVRTESTVIEEVKKLLETMVSELGAGSMIEKQFSDIDSLKSEVAKLRSAAPPFTQDQWDEARDFETRTRQRFEIVKANYRATLRVQANLKDLVAAWPDNPAVKVEEQKVMEELVRADLKYKEIERMVNEILESVKELSEYMQREGKGSLVTALNEMVETINSTATQCQELKNIIELNSASYRKYEIALTEPLDEETREQKRQELLKLMDLIRSQDKQFTNWNKTIVTPWKELQNQITWAKLGTDPLIEQRNRLVTQAYDAYVVALSDGQDLAQDHLILVSSLFDRYKGVPANLERCTQELKRLMEILESPFGPPKMILKQQLEIKSIQRYLAKSKGKTDRFEPKDWICLIACDTRTRQALEIAKANNRAAERARLKIDCFSKDYSDNPQIHDLKSKTTEAVNNAILMFTELENTCPAILREVKELEDLRPVLG